MKRPEFIKQLQTRLDGCMGCGCLSLEACQLYNRDDHAGEDGPGPQFVLGED